MYSLERMSFCCDQYIKSGQIENFKKLSEKDISNLAVYYIMAKEEVPDKFSGKTEKILREIVNYHFGENTLRATDDDYSRYCIYKVLTCSKVSMNTFEFEFFPPDVIFSLSNLFLSNKEWLDNEVVKIFMEKNAKTINSGKRVGKIKSTKDKDNKLVG